MAFLICRPFPRYLPSNTPPTFPARKAQPVIHNPSFKYSSRTPNPSSQFPSSQTATTKQPTLPQSTPTNHAAKMHMTTLLLPLLPLLTLAADLDIQRTSGPEDCQRKTRNGDTIQVHYRGTLAADGSQFDASYDRGTPLSFQLGAGRVIKGWEQGLLDMCVGAKRTLTIPPELGYGSRAMGPIPAGSTLVFETELMGIQGVKKDEL